MINQAQPHTGRQLKFCYEEILVEDAASRSGEGHSLDFLQPVANHDNKVLNIRDDAGGSQAAAVAEFVQCKF